MLVVGSIGGCLEAPTLRAAHTELLEHSWLIYRNVELRNSEELLAYGSADTRVPLIHGEKFNQAVRKTNQDVEWVVYEGEGHGWTLPQNRIDFWTRMEKFLDRHIGSTRGDTGAK